MMMSTAAQKAMIRPTPMAVLILLCSPVRTVRDLPVRPAEQEPGGPGPGAAERDGAPAHR
ncbi:hypothetical protein ACPCUV_22790 [Streptomyces platensis]|uniref:hypothetical protein n=1 Tax=Streptomyces platensis TaxID=58346 RepID=UPI003C2EC9A1